MTCAHCPPVHAVHLSLKWSAHPDVVAAYVAAVVAAEDPDLITTTESKGRAKAVRAALGKAYRVCAAGEFLVIYRRATFGRWHAWPARYRTAKGASWRNGPHAGLREFAALFVNLQHLPTGCRFRVIVTHATSHVQVGTHWRALPDRVGPYRRGMSWLGRHVRKAERHGDVVQIVAMDSNLEQHLTRWRTYLETTLGLPSIWCDSRPAGGTEGRRLIDTAHTNRPVTGQRLCKRVPRPGIIDHGGIAYDVHPDA